MSVQDLSTFRVVLADLMYYPNPCLCFCDDDFHLSLPQNEGQLDEH